MIPYVVIGGYLGAGKTTLLNRLLRTATDRRIGLLINDFGEINIDAALIESATDQQINLTNGCICCSLADGFTEAIDRLIAIGPSLDMIVVEASGVADVALLSQYGFGHGLRLHGAIVLADAETIIEHANDRYVGRTVRRQLSAADLIVITRCDIVSSGQTADARSWIEDNFSGIPVLESPTTDISNLLVDDLKPVDHHTPVESGSHERYTTCTVTRPHPVNREALGRFIDALGPDVIRAKGTAALTDGSTALVQVVGRRREITEATTSVEGLTLVFIGFETNPLTTLIETLSNQYLPIIARELC